MVPLAFETFYAGVPQKPYWVRALSEELARLKSKKLPIADTHIVRSLLSLLACCSLDV